MKYIILFATAIAFSLSSCKTDTGDPGKDSRARATNQALAEAGTVLGKAAVSALFNVASQEATGGKVNFQQGATEALWANVNLADSAAAIHRIVVAYSGGNAPATAEAAAKAAGGGNVTPAKVNAIASVISAATGAPPPLK